MEFGSLGRTYFEKQVGRIGTALERIVAQSSPLASGYIVPDGDDLALGMGRRLNTTIMFIDICKFSERPSETDAEQTVLLRVLNLFFTEMIRIISDYGGTVEKNTGDGLMAYFVSGGEPSVSAQQKALTAALTMFATASAVLNPVLMREGIEAVDFRVCMDHGEVTIAKLGAAQRFNGIVAIGTKANIASKMLSKADRNEILLGEGMLGGLPSSWIDDYVRVKVVDTGWHFRATGLPYCFYSYLGRWSALT